HHVLRQLLTQLRAQSVNPQRRSRFRHEVTDQSLLSLALFQYHYRFIHSLTSAQHTLDLAQLDPEAAHLHLLIHTAKKFDIAVGPVSRQIARAIQPRSILSKRMRHKFLRRQLRSSQITTRQTVTADIEFSHYSCR